MGDVDFWGGIVDEVGDQLSSDGGERESHHGVAGGDDEVAEFWGVPKVRESVGRAGSEADPGGEVFEVGGLVLGVELTEGLDDSLESWLADGGVFSANLHGSGNAQGIAHGRDCNTSFFEKGAELRIGNGFRESEGVAFAALHGEVEADLFCEAGGVDASSQDDGFGLIGFASLGGDAFGFTIGSG